MTKVSLKKQKKLVFRLDADLGHIEWESKQRKIIPIENIKEIRSGDDARYYREQFQLSSLYQERWLTIVYILDGAYKSLHLVAATKDVSRMWDRTLRDLHSIRLELMRGLGNVEMRQALWEKQHWRNANEDNDHRLTFDEVEKLCRRLNINSDYEDLLRLFNQADTRKRQFLDFDDFRRFVKLLKARPEIDRLYKKLRSRNDGHLDFGVFEKFMREKQVSTLSSIELQRVFEKYSSWNTSPTDLGNPAHASTAPVMTLEGFTSFLLSQDNSVLADQHRDAWQDMTRPLSEYFVSSSHNTYLVGHQLVGVSTIEGYIRALLHGCRSVEVDVFDGEQEPMIFHGKTLTSKVSLREVCQTISKYGFVASPYPIIISAEVHCGLAGQDMIAEIMIEEFGDSLVRAPADSEGKIDNLPSPEDLKGKILLKTKNLNLMKTESALDSDREEGVSSDVVFSDSTDAEAFWEGKDSPTRRLLSSEVEEDKRAPSRSLSRRRASDVGGDRPHAKPKMSFALVALLVYTVGVKFRGINKKEEYAPEHMFSLSENTAHKQLRVGMWDLIKHTKAHLVRTYPKGTRVSSTNYEPHRFWAAGMQLVAINWQTSDLGYMINHAMFQRNGRSGYVLKPNALRLAQKEHLAKRTTHSFDVTIISAQQLPRPKGASGRDVPEKTVVDPFVEVTLYLPDWPLFDGKMKDKGKAKAYSSDGGHLSPLPSRALSSRTLVVRKNGWNPVWEEKLTILFDCVGDMMDLIFVRFVVKQDDKGADEPLAMYCAPLGSLQHGYRHLPLHDSQLSQYLFSTLFVKINVTNLPC
ncbi:PLC-like phosphodiesterase [Gymnopilus junonius]|uniref:Phosphoinositide phospholipase C n=1 Tax=Gymnopilus junonius TaxID=109634 RepID=A0A9P5NBQ1_GYMJU|nr:PLC-like phosphodiesterase [Gymnopilus junonius]